jgi:hypothetical protein
MMIGVPSQFVVTCAAGRWAAGCRLGRADAVASAPRRRTATAKPTILDNDTLMS